MAKFKIGDKVRVLDGSKAEYYAGFWIEPMAQFVGKVAEINRIIEDKNDVVYKLDGCSYLHGSVHYSFDENYLEKVEEDEEKAEDEENTYLALEWCGGEPGGEVGIMTGFKDINGEKLCIGDVVEVYDKELESCGEAFVYFDKVLKRETVTNIIDTRYDRNCDGRFKGAGIWYVIKRKSFETLEEGFAIKTLKVVRRKRSEW